MSVRDSQAKETPKYRLVVEPIVDKDGKIQNTPSPYNPDERTKERLKDIKSDMELADQVRNYPFREFGYRDLTTVANDCQDRFINLIEDYSEDDPDLAWRANTMRPLTRNKVIEVAAYITTRIMEPLVIAQDNDDNEDRNIASVMADVMDWANNLSDYEINFLYAVIQAEVFPISYMEEGYVDYERDFKVIKEDGTFDIKKMKDEVYSGFYSDVVSWDEIYQTDAYAGKDIQRQPALIRRRIMPFSQAKVKYGDNDNFNDFVSPGLRNFYGDDDSIYQEFDESIGERNVEELTYYNRIADLEIRLVNGVMMDDPDRPLQRKSKRYPFASFGYGLYDSGKFIYYKSLVDDLKPDQDQADTLINLILDGTFLRVFPPSAIIGGESIDTGIMIPGAAHPMPEGASITPIQTSSDVNLASNVLRDIELNASNSSQKDISQPRQQTAYEISRIEEDIKVKLGLFGKFIAQFVKDFGILRIETILTTITMPEIGELASSESALKYATIVHQGKDGKKKKISFNLEQTTDVSKEEELALSAELLMQEKKEGGSVSDAPSIAILNPKMFKDFRYNVMINPAASLKNSPSAELGYAMSFYNIAAGNPVAEQTELFRFITEKFYPGNSERFVKDEQKQQEEAQAQQQAPEGQAPQGQPAGLEGMLEQAEAPQPGLPTA